MYGCATASVDPHHTGHLSEEPHLGRLYARPCSFGHRQHLITSSFSVISIKYFSNCIPFGITY
ncbi:UNVERIFIED_CONTAM: hypothetical protein PYX00_000377 [Menopon gallinae]|uniref:Uncharacterized protein n=1 Tax=Menopon gallinae TaxID=328185 RepID=A0AAW2IAY3_9NEOP